ncbi:MAG: carboxypeptidase-like regulatory domain-containing protein, partial [Bacteroidota bacterium]
MPMTSLLRSIQLFVPFITLLLVTSFLPMQAQNPSKGRIIGSVVDSETGEAILGANVILEGTTLGAATDINGTYLINAEPGEYTLTVSVLSYAKHTVTGIRVSAGEPVRIDIAMKPEWIETEEVVVTAKMLQNTEATTLITRQR